MVPLQSEMSASSIHQPMHYQSSDTEGALLILTQTTKDDLDEDSPWDGPYSDGMDIPNDPWGNPYRYVYPSEQSANDYPDIWSAGPDGEDDTEDDIVNWKKSEDENRKG